MTDDLMSRIWFSVNIALVMAGGVEGYQSTAPEIAMRTNVDIIACAAVFFTALGVSYFGVLLSIKKMENKHLRSPSWYRNVFAGWKDPLQFLFVLRWIFAALVLGGGLGLVFRLTTPGAWLVGSYCSIFLGLALGALLVRRTFSEIISSPHL